MRLPDSYKEKMKQILGQEYEAYEESFQRPHYTGLRVNTLKISPEEFLKISPFELTRVPWTTNGFYYDSKVQPAKHPFYYAGLYYIQEPSAMTPAAMLPIEEGDKVLDLCAAPGGKSTELAAKLKGSGVLITNDISNSRAKALLKNIELFGVRNSVVVSEPPEKLTRYFPEYFDKILVDAPCSGEGMFRKDPAIIKSWEQYGVKHYNALQLEIILYAAKMLKPGGKLLYSTCTFSPEENEGTIMHLLKHYPEFEILPMQKIDGFMEGRPELVEGGVPELKNTIRIWPHKVKGEGHYVALLQKGKPVEAISPTSKYKKVKLSEEVETFIKQLKVDAFKQNYEMHNDRLNALPEGLPSLEGLRLLRAGMYLGDIKKNRFEPSQSLAMALHNEEYPEIVDLRLNDERVIRYLKGETIEIDQQKAKGYQLICVEGFPLGWGKAANGTLKNKYHTGWRWL